MNPPVMGSILDRMDEIEDSWEECIEEFNMGKPNAKVYYCFDKDPALEEKIVEEKMSLAIRIKEKLTDHYPHGLLKTVHTVFFDKTAGKAFAKYTLTDAVSGSGHMVG